MRRLLGRFRGGRIREWPPIPDGGLGLSSPFVEGPRVKVLQDRLVELGYAVGAPGVYDVETAAAVRELRADHGLPTDRDHAHRASPELLERIGLQ